VAQRLRRTPGSTKDYLGWLEDVDLVGSSAKRYHVRDPILRLWVRLYCHPTPPSDEAVALEVQRYALRRLPAGATDPATKAVPRNPPHGGRTSRASEPVGSR
jgi:hypothetical protein